MFGSNGYVSEMMSRERFRACIKRLAEDIPLVMKELGAEAIAVRGKSGVAVVHALALLIDIDIAIIRKPGENSHGERREGWGIACHDAIDKPPFKYIIIDDFISSGETVRQILMGMGKQVCVGVVCYQAAATDWVLETHRDLRETVAQGWDPCPMYTELPAVPVFCYVPKS